MHNNSVHDKAESDLAAAQQARTKLNETLPNYREQAQAYGDLAKDGYVGKLAAADKARELTEKEQDLKTPNRLISVNGLASHLISNSHATLPTH